MRIVSKLHEWLKSGIPRYRNWNVVHRHRQLVKKGFVEFEGLKFDIRSTHEPVAEAAAAGLLEFEERRLARKLLSSSDRVLECGGNLGYVAVTVRRELGIAHWVSLEPNPKTAKIYAANCQINGIEPKLIEAAIASVEGSVHLNCSAVSGQDSLLPNASGSNLVVVQALTLPSVLKRLPWEPTAMIIDIEGAEDFLLNCELPDSVKTLIIELHPELTGPKLAFRILARLLEQRFSVEDYRHSVYGLVRN